MQVHEHPKAFEQSGRGVSLYLRAMRKQMEAHRERTGTRPVPTARRGWNNGGAKLDELTRNLVCYGTVTRLGLDGLFLEIITGGAGRKPARTTGYNPMLQVVKLDSSLRWNDGLRTTHYLPGLRNSRATAPFDQGR